ncbi:MAG: site-specific integrase [Desulfurellales bacterium]|nr:MAG: site-specific integrase [Desulfurellales bacterium]
MPKVKKRSTLPYTRIKQGKLYVVIPYRVGDRWKQKARLARDQAHALQVMAELRDELGRHGPSAFAGDRMLFHELLAEYRRAHPGTPDWYWRPMLEYFRERQIRSITYADLKQFRSQRAATPKRFSGEARKAATVNRELEHLRAVLLYAMRHGWVRYNPFAAGPPLITKGEEEQRSRVPTPEEEERFLAQCVPPRAHLRPLVIATRDTGLRRSALLALTWEMVDFEGQLIRIPKGNLYKRRPAVIGCTDRLLGELRRLWEASEQDPAARVFGEVKGWKRSYATACRLAGIEGLRFNDWRHGFATDLMEANVPRHLAMKLSGHTQEATHEIYANIDDRLAIQAAAALDRLHASRTTRSAEPEPATGLVN